MSQTNAFPTHIFDALGVEPHMFEDRIGGSVGVLEKRPENGPITLMTSGLSHLPTDSGERVELAVEVVDGQQGAAWVALQIVCDNIASGRQAPPVGAPWRNGDPFLNGTNISAIMVTPSRWGAAFDEVQDEDGAVVGHVRTLRLLTDSEAALAGREGWQALVDAVGSVDALLDISREDTVPAQRMPDNAPVFVSKLHDEHPPRWVTCTGNSLESVTGLESEEYMAEQSNLQVIALSTFLARFPWVEGFVREARAGQTALFTDDSGKYTLEDD